MRVKVVTESELRRALPMDADGLAAVEAGFRALAAGEATLPPIMRIDVPDRNGEVDVKSAYVRGGDRFAVKLSSGFFDNHRLGLPSASGLMIVVSARTGVPEAVLLDNGYLTDVRTGLAGALAAKYLAPRQVRTVGVLGSGAQARYQLEALALVRGFERVVAYSPNGDHLAAYVADMAASLGVEVAAAGGAEEVVRAADVLVTTTPARAPIVRAAWLHPGLHITAMGSDAEHKNELEPAVVAAADLLACDSLAQCMRLGELRAARAAGLLAAEPAVVELGVIAAGRHPGRQRRDAISVCDLTGTGVQDTAIANLALARAEARGSGVDIEA